MQPFDLPFNPGITPADRGSLSRGAQNRGPLARYYPPVPAGVAAPWLKDHVAPGSWILDPFGTSPSQALEMAVAGYRVLITVNNPITSFVIKTLGSAPRPEELRAAIADLASARKGEERLERFVQAVYTVECPGCGRPIPAKSFIWQRQAEYPDRCVIDCPHCGLSGEQPVSPSSQERLAALLPHASHSRARALERVAPLDDPIRSDVEQALQCYLPRPVYVLFNLLNQIEKLPTTPERINALTALLLTVCDEGNTLWPYPIQRSRPRQLVIPSTFRENNLWMALEDAIDEWQGPAVKIPVTHWPQLPPATGGICLFQGRVRDLTADLAEHQTIGLSDLPVKAIVTVFPRPNQAFWTLSALWAGWLWGREAVLPLKSALARQRYDWNWHTAALTATLSHLSTHSGLAVPFWGFVSEVEPAFLTAVIAAADISNFKLEGLALRHDASQAEILWAITSKDLAISGSGSAGADEKVINQVLEKRGEAAPYLVLQAAATAACANRRQFKQWAGQKEQTALQEFQAAQQKIFSESGPLVRYGGGQHSLETALYWNRAVPHGNPSLSDKIEKEIVQSLVGSPICQLEPLDQHLCQLFTGLDTPPRGLILTCLASYGEPHPIEKDSWSLRQNETPAARRKELKAIQDLLCKMGVTLGYTVQGAGPLLWLDTDGQVAYEYHVMASGMVSRCVMSSQVPPQNAVIVIPGSRADLIMDKLRRDPWLNEKISAGWTFLKFRHLRYLAGSSELTREVWKERLPRDPLESKATQLEMF